MKDIVNRGESTATEDEPAGHIEEGEAFREIARIEVPVVQGGSSFASAISRRADLPERVDVVVIGAGQAGLSVGYYLARQGLRFVILEAAARVGDQWRRRWDSLRLFTPARYDSLPGMRFPAPRNAFPTKDEMADYLETYAARFQLPVRTRVRVERVSRSGNGYLVTTDGGTLEAQHVIVAMALYQKRRVPAFASALRPSITQLHSSEYRNPAQLREGSVLVVGAGNSGAEIAVELAKRGHATWLAGRNTGHVPFRIGGLLASLLLAKLVLRVVFHHVLTIRTPMGRKARAGMTGKGAPLIRLRPADLAEAGVRRVARVTGVRDGLPLVADDAALDVANVVWCTGFDPGFSWIDLPVFDAGHAPRHDGGVVPDQPGLYFVGLHFLYAASSTMIHGVGRDAERIVKTIASRVTAARAR